MKHISEAIINIGITHAILSRYIPLSFAILNLKLKQTSGLAFRTKTLFSSSFKTPNKAVWYNYRLECCLSCTNLKLQADVLGNK